jgi:hypothetical protein
VILRLLKSYSSKQESGVTVRRSIAQVLGKCDGVAVPELGRKERQQAFEAGAKRQVAVLQPVERYGEVHGYCRSRIVAERRKV